MLVMEEEVTEVKRELRDFPPAHYLFKIENFSLLSDSKIDYYESTEFVVGGEYKWKLRVYPNGKKKKLVNEEGYISLYLVLSAFPFHWEVNVSFKLFVYNQILDKYLTVQDAKERVRRFRGSITECGFDQFVPLNVFNDASNGYLVNDCCVFGAEVLLVYPTIKAECASMIKKLDNNNNTYTWNIENYRQLEEEYEYYSSPEFVIGGYKWTLCVYPNGYANEEGKSLSMYLYLMDSINPGEWLQIRYIIRIRGQNPESKDIERLDTKEYAYNSYSWSGGFNDLMPLSYLKEPSQGYVDPDGIMIAEVEILLMTLIKDVF